MAEARHEQTLSHLRLLAGLPGYWELRALRRDGANPMTPRGSFWIAATATADGLLYERLDQALAWADGHDRQGTDLFVGVNARSIEGKTKAAVPAVTCCFADLDLGGESIDEALAALTSGPTPAPSFIVHSGYGLHAVWLLREASRDKAQWRTIQRGIVQAFADYGADPVCAPNEACILRLVPYPNRKLSPTGVPTALVMESGSKYDHAALHDAFALPAATRVHDIPGPAPPFVSPPEAEGADEGTGDRSVAEDLSAERMEELVENTAAIRALLARYIRMTFKPGVHYGVIPVDAQTTSKPTLLKAGAEMVCLLFGWRARFTADAPILQMYGPGVTGTFALVCELIDRHGQVVGQGRGVAELRETSMTSANMAVKMAEKRAYVDAVLRAAGLSQYFTQDLEDMLLLPPSKSEDASPSEATHESPDPEGEQGSLCTARQRQAIRALLPRAGKTERWLLAKLQAKRLDDLLAARAELVIRRLSELAKERTNPES
jgi:hypothetical protein